MRQSRRGFLSAVILVSALTLSACASNETAGELVQVSASETSGLVSEDAELQAAPRDAEYLALVEAVGLEVCPIGVDNPDAAVPGLPDLTLECLGAGDPASLSSLRGMPMVVNVWASWCPPCIAELPLLSQAANDLKGEVSFLGIDLQDDPSAALMLLQDFGVTFPSFVDRRGDTRASLAIPGPPVTFFIQSDGKIVGRKDGMIESREQLAGLINEYLGVVW